MLRAKSMRGYSFLRQRPIGEYIVDFFSKELKLVIELDGPDHDSKLNRDNKKDRYLESIGLKILRFYDEEVIQDINSVYQVIEDYINEYELKKLNS